MYKILNILFLLLIFYSSTFLFHVIIRDFKTGYINKIFYSLLVSFLITFFCLIEFNLLQKEYYFTFLIILLLNSYIYLNVIQIIISSIRVNILKSFLLNKVKKKKLDDKKIFQNRINRLVSAKIILISKKKLIFNNRKILILLKFYILFKKIYGIKKIYD